MTYFTLIQKLWNDDCGGVIASEYLMVGSILGLGTVSGLSAMRDASVEEMAETGNSIRAVREHYTPKQFQKNQTPPDRGQAPAATTGQSSGSQGFCP